MRPLLRILAAYLAAVLAASGVITLATFLFESQDIVRAPGAWAGSALLVGVVTVIPAVLLITISERIQGLSRFVYVAGAAALGLVLPPLAAGILLGLSPAALLRESSHAALTGLIANLGVTALAGGVAGWVYWLVRSRDTIAP